MRPQIIIKGVYQTDDGEAWAFANNVRMVEWEEAVGWDFRTEKVIEWQPRRCPAPLFDGMPYSTEKRNVFRRVPNVGSNGSATRDA